MSFTCNGTWHLSVLPTLPKINLWSFVDFVFLKRDVYPSGKKTSSFLPSFLHPLPTSVMGREQGTFILGFP
jgi:hypothetical protein